jgi:hypothetical protein
MAVSAISSVSGGYARLLRALPGADVSASNEGVAENSAPETEPQAGAPAEAESASTVRRKESEAEKTPGDAQGQAILDEDELTERSKRARREMELGGRSLEANLQIASLRSRDLEVRTHESAHMAVGGGYVIGGAVFSYQTGPDGLRYAVGGEVGIDTASVPGKPEETVRKMRVVKAAALAPSRPSAADFAVAAAAAQAEAAAMAEIAVGRSRELAARYSDEMSAARPAAGAVPASGAASAPLREDGSPSTPFDVIA